MSHFTVLVVGKDFEGSLAPYQENNGDCPEKYLEFMVEVPKITVKQYIKDKLLSMSSADRAKYVHLSQKKFMSTYAGFRANEKGDYGYFGNPDSRWDWYRMGGRWRGFFKLKPGKTGTIGERSSYEKKDERIWPGGVDQARKGDIDFTGMYKAKPKDVATFAVLMDGEWYQKGDMGWWGIVSKGKTDDVWQKEFKKLLDVISDDELLTLVDCHI